MVERAARLVQVFRTGWLGHHPVTELLVNVMLTFC